MKLNNTDAATLFKMHYCVFYSFIYIIKFPVYGNSKGLKRLSGRVNAFRSVRMRYSRTYNISQLTGSCNCRPASFPHNGRHDPPGPSFFSELLNYFYKFSSIEVVYKLCSSCFFSCVHAHVERTVLPEAESALR